MTTDGGEQSTEVASRPPPVRWEAPPAPGYRARAGGRVTLIQAVGVVVVLVAGGLGIRDRIFPPAWSASSVRLIAGDTWDGNLVSDGHRMVLLSREGIDGFWGVMTIRASEDGGATWGGSTSISPRHPDAARHALALGSGSSLWAAWAEQGPVVASQRLVVRHSLDGGATWTAPVRLSRPNVGLVGIPALVVSDSVRLAAFTDGTTGDVIVQRFDPDGAADGEPVIVGRTTRELYSNAQFLDGGLAVAAVENQVTLVYDDGSAARALVSSDGGRRWQEAWSERRTTAEPRVVARGGRFIVLTASATGRIGEVRARVSDDGGATWSRAASWVGSPASALSISTGSERVLAAWAVCADIRCARTQLWVGDVASGLTRPTRIDLGDRARPVGVALAGRSMVVASVREQRTGRADARTLVLAAGSQP